MKRLLTIAAVALMLAGCASTTDNLAQRQPAPLAVLGQTKLPSPM